jgi:hypothetical protein
MLDPLHVVFSWIQPGKVHSPDAALVAATSMSDGDLSGVVSSSNALPFPGYRQREMRSSLPEMVIDRTP